MCCVRSPLAACTWACGWGAWLATCKLWTDIRSRRSGPRAHKLGRQMRGGRKSHTGLYRCEQWVEAVARAASHLVGTGLGYDSAHAGWMWSRSTWPPPEGCRPTRACAWGEPCPTGRTSRLCTCCRMSRWVHDAGHPLQVRNQPLKNQGQKGGALGLLCRLLWVFSAGDCILGPVEHCQSHKHAHVLFSGLQPLTSVQQALCIAA